jgi:hypothetical protein
MSARQRISIVALIATLMISGCTPTVIEEPAVALGTSAIIPGSGIFESALALDLAGVPHIAFVSRDGVPELRYRAGSGMPEKVANIGQLGQMEFTLHLALTNAGRPGIVFNRAGQLFYSERGATGWLTEQVDADEVGYFASLAYDRIAQPHISYFDLGHNDIKYATRTPHGWLIETIDASGQPGFHIPAGFTRIAVSCRQPDPLCSEARPQIVYLAFRYKPYDGELRYAVRLDRGWQITTIDSDRGAGGFPSLVLDKHGQPWVSYYRASTWDFAWAELRLAHLDDQGWQIETLDQGTYVGRSNAVSINPAGHPIVVYYIATADTLRIMWHSDR